MLTKMIPVVLFATIMIFSCKNDSEDIVEDIVQDTIKEEGTKEDTTSIPEDPNFQGCDSVYIANFYATGCCATGPKIAKPGEIHTFHYQINHDDPRLFSWKVGKGDMTIIKGQDTHTVTVQFGPDFTEGLIYCVGSAAKGMNRIECTDAVLVRNF